MLREGGLLDQPAGLWFAAQTARYYDEFYRKVTKEGFKIGDLEPSERPLHKELLKIQNELARQ